MAGPETAALVTVAAAETGSPGETAQTMADTLPRDRIESPVPVPQIPTSMPFPNAKDCHCRGPGWIEKAGTLLYTHKVGKFSSSDIIHALYCKRF